MNETRAFVSLQRFLLNFLKHSEKYRVFIFDAPEHDRLFFNF